MSAENTDFKAIIAENDRLQKENEALRLKQDEINRRSELIAERERLQKELTFGNSKTEAVPVAPVNVRRYRYEELPENLLEQKAIVTNSIKQMYAHRSDDYAKGAMNEQGMWMKLHLQYLEAKQHEKAGTLYNQQSSAKVAQVILERAKALPHAGLIPFFLEIHV